MNLLTLISRILPAASVLFLFVPSSGGEGTPATAKTLPRFSADTEDLSGLDDMLARFHAACNMDAAGTFSLAWLPRAMLWVGDAPQAGESVTRARIANRIGSMRISADGYVSCHQHEGLAHSEGWPFPLPSQSEGVGFLFSTAGLPYGPEFGVMPAKDVDGWKLEHAKTLALDAVEGWSLDLTAPGATVTSPEFSVDALVSPFFRVKWDASGLPPGSKPYLEWTTEAEPEFAASRRMEFPSPSSASKFPVQDFDIPIHEITEAQGKLTRVRIGFGNPAPGKVTLLRVFTAVDSRHTINNPNYLIAASDYFDWTGDRDWLAANLEKMRLATAYMISEFQVRDAHLLRTPWIGHDGRSGLEYKEDGEKIIHTGVGVGGNYWDLIPFGGDDVLGTIYLFSALERMAQIEEFVAAQKLLPDSKPADGLDAASLRSLAKAVRGKFQERFWNPETKRFAPKDDQGRFRDYGFTFLNNEAIFYGLASKEQAEDILSWLDGDRVVEGDTSQGEDIYKFRFAPRATTKRNIEYYAYVWFRPEDLKFGDQVQDGGAVLGFTYHDLMARIRYLGADNAWERLREILAWYREVQEAGGARAYYAVPGRGTLQGGGTAGGLGIDEEFYESVLAPAIALDGFIGFSVRPDGFDLNPKIPDGIGKLAVTNVAYRDLIWDVEAAPDRVSFLVRSGKVDSPLRVGLPDGAWTVKVMAEKEGPEKVMEIAPGSQSFELPAGPLHQLSFFVARTGSDSQWQRDQRDLLTNFDNMYQPCVVETGGEYPYKMWFFGWAAARGNPDWPGSDAIFHARSKDLKTWEIYSGEGKWDSTMNPEVWVPVLHASDRWYDAYHIGDPSVVLKDGKFYMAYSATSKHFKEREGYPATMVQCVMGAISDDGITWRKTEQPLLIREGDTPDPKPEPGRIGDFHRPSLLWDEGKWRLWFDYWLPGGGVCMGYAENRGDFGDTGGFQIQHDLEKPLIRDWPNPEVIRIGDAYHSFSDAPGYPGKSGWTARQLREAVSEDGITWRLRDFISPDDDTEANHVPQALATTIEGQPWLYLFYSTQVGTKRNDGVYHFEYDRIRAMRRPIVNPEQTPAGDVPKPQPVK
jgi:hypothetical protein